MRTMKKFVGINNVQERDALRDNELSVGDNVDIDLVASVRRRAGFSQESMLHHNNVWQATGFLLATRGAAGDLVNISTNTVLRAALGHTRLWYCNLPDGRTIYSNGVQSGVVSAAAATAWGVPIPATAGSAMEIAGDLFPGKYQWALTHVRTVDGIEGGPVYCNEDAIDITTGGILLSDIPVLAGHRTNVYLTSHNGAERYLAGSTLNDSFMFTGKNTALQQRLLTEDMSAPPAGKLVGFWRGRSLVAVGNALFASLPNSWELFDLRRDFKNFSAPITMVQPVNGGIWVGTEEELSFLAGATWDKLERNVMESGRVVLGSGVPVPGTQIKYRDGRADGDCMICICNGWLVAGLGDGVLVPMSRDRYRVNTAEVSASFRMNGDVPQYIAIVQ